MHAAGHAHASLSMGLCRDATLACFIQHTLQSGMLLPEAPIVELKNDHDQHLELQQQRAHIESMVNMLRLPQKPVGS